MYRLISSSKEKLLTTVDVSCFLMQVPSVLSVKFFKKQCSDTLPVKKPLFVIDYEKISYFNLDLCHSC